VRARELAALLPLFILAACGSSERAPAAREASPEATAEAAAAPPHCPVDPTTLPPLPGWNDEAAAPEREGRERLTPEIIATPELGRCVPPEDLFDAAPTRGPVIGAITGEGTARRFALHQVNDVAVLGDGPYLLAAGRSGLFLHDGLTLARRARLIEAPALAVAASPDGRRAAVLLEAASPDASGSRALVVFDPDTLEVIARLEGAPPGRLRFSPDGERVVIASPEKRLFVWDGDTDAPRVVETPDELSDAAFAPDHPDVVAYVGEQNQIQYRSLETGEPIAQSGGAALRTRRDLNTLALVPSAGLTVAGGDDNRVHLYRGMLGERAEEIASIELDGNVEDLACCRGSRFVAGTDEGQIQWFDGATRVRSLGPLVPTILGGSIRLSLYGDDVVGALFGQLFRWTAGDVVVRAPCAPGQLLLVDASEEDVLVVLRMGAKVVVHRVVGERRPSAMTEELGELAWADALRVVQAPGGGRALIGLDHDGIQVAFIDAREGLSAMVGPGMALSVSFEVTPGEPGHYALWDRRGVIYELDVPEKRWRLLGHVDPDGGELTLRYDPRRGYQALREGKRRMTIVAAAEAEPSAEAAP
jgi:hypothetical protein